MISSGDDGIVVGEVEKGDGAMTGRAWRENALSVVTERFERRLTEEISGLRVDMANGFASLRQEMAEGNAKLRQEMYEGLATTRVELLKWSFLFWTGQVVVLGGLMAILR